MVQTLAGLAENLQGNGCSIFFFTSAIQSSVFGEVGRRNQAELLDSNIEFKERMRQLKDEFQKERLDAQIVYRRESYELGKQFLIRQTAELNDNRQKEIEFQYFLENYWPLNYSAYSMILEQNKLLRTTSVIPLRVLIAMTEVTSSRSNPNKSYDDFCRNIKSGLQQLPNVVVEMRPWKSKSNSMMCESMNVNYIMQGIPTLLVFPYQIGEMFGIEVASWSFLRGNRSMMQNKILQIDYFNATEALGQTHSAVKAVIGMTRDAYMLSEYHAPICYPALAKTDSNINLKTREMLNQHYQSLYELVNNNDKYKQLCTNAELAEINKSFETIKLLR